MKEDFLKSGFRWYGDKDPVSLAFIRQAGVESIFSSLHDIPYGEVWSVEKIKEHQKKIEKFGMTWDVVESVPVSEAIKTRSGDFLRHIENYKETIKNLAKCGIKIVVYNFMPVLDWIRTDLKYTLGDGSRCLKFDIVQFAAFEIFILKREAAKKEYSKETVKKAEKFFKSLSKKQLSEFEKAIIDVFPGCKMGLKIADVREMIAKYKDIGEKELKENLKIFLQEVVPVAEKCGVRLAIHPDDPPFDVLGLPRIASCLDDFKEITNCVKSPSNGICFCTGSLSAGAHNDILKLIDGLKDKIVVAHLRSTQRLSDGSFYEAGHLEGSVPMYETVKKLLALQKKGIKKNGRIIFRPDHGRDMADDLDKPSVANPGYTFIGRMKGLAELRGLQTGILKG